MTQNINEEIDNTHFKTYGHVQKHVKNKFPRVKDKKIKKVLSKRLKDKFIRTKNIKPLMIKIFSSIPNCWFHDLYDNTKGKTPRYWHVFIGTNNRYVYCLPLMSKSAGAVHETLKTFIEKFHPVKLTSDEEPAFIEKNNLKLLSDHKVAVHTISDKNHSALGIIDRFMRTIRDMNTPSEKSKHQSHDEKYTFITPERMKKFLNIYNNTYHSAIGCSPKEMFEDKDLEKEYIFKCLEASDKQKRIKDLILPVNSFVRFILPRHNGITKKRFQISRECYKIDERKGNMYVLIAQDGTVITKPRFKLIPIGNKKPENIKWASTIPGKWNGTIEKILSFNPKTNKYKVLFSVPGKRSYQDEIPASFLRGNTPHKQSEIEKEFFKNISTNTTTTNTTTKNKTS